MDSYLLVCVLAIFVAFYVGTIVPSKNDRTQSHIQTAPPTEEVGSFSVREGSFIVLKPKNNLTPEQITNIKGFLSSQCDDAIKFLILPCGIDIFGLFEPQKNNNEDEDRKTLSRIEKLLSEALSFQRSSANSVGKPSL